MCIGLLLSVFYATLNIQFLTIFSLDQENPLNLLPFFMLIGQDVQMIGNPHMGITHFLEFEEATYSLKIQH